MLKLRDESDDAMQQQNLAVARELRDLLRSNPRADWSQIEKVVLKHPQLDEMFKMATGQALPDGKSKD